MGDLERMVILPETRSGRMKLRWVNWLTNWITSVRSRLSKDITTVFALVWMSFRFTGAVAGGSVSRVGRAAAFCGDAWFGADPVAGADPGVAGAGRAGCADG